MDGPSQTPDEQSRVPAFKAVVFDLGNVLIAWDPVAAVARSVGQSEATRFLTDPQFDFMGWNHFQDAGRRWEEAEDEAIGRHPHYEPHIRGYRQNFPHSLTGALPETVRILRELHAAGVRLCGLTNWSAELFPAARERFDFLQLFDDIVVSGEEMVAKPDARIFAIVERRMGVALSECVFTDDNQRNVDAARAAGMDAVLFTDAVRLRQDLRERGLPLAPA